MNQIELLTDVKTTDPEHRVVMLSRLWRMILRIPSIHDTVKRIVQFPGCQTQTLAITDIDTHDVAVYVRYVGNELTLWVEESKSGLNVRWDIWDTLHRTIELDLTNDTTSFVIYADKVITDIKKLEHITKPYSDEEIVAEVMEFLYDYSDFGEYHE